MERRVRALHAHSLLVDAQRRMAATGDGAVADLADALQRRGGLRLAAHPGADARVRRRRGSAAGTGRGLSGADAVPRQEHSEWKWPSAFDSRARTRAASGGAGESGAAVGRVSHRYPADRQPESITRCRLPPLTIARFSATRAG